jgi:hypothetical protein
MTGPGQLKDNLKITFSSLEAILDLFLDLFFPFKNYFGTLFQPTD